MAIDKEELKQAIREVMAESCAAACKLEPNEIENIKTVSGFLTKCRNYLGNLLMLVIVVILVAGVGGVIYLATGGHVNLFKILGG